MAFTTKVKRKTNSKDKKVIYELADGDQGTVLEALEMVSLALRDCWVPAAIALLQEQLRDRREC